MAERINLVLGYALAVALAALTGVIGHYGHTLTGVIERQGEQLTSIVSVTAEQGARIRSLEQHVAAQRGDSRRAPDAQHR